MAKTSGPARERLISAGKKLIYKQGVSGLKVREAARLAGVNLGLFHYHFGSRKEFVRLILKEIYAEFFSQFKLSVSGGGDSLERLEKALVTLGFFARQNRALVLALLQDTLSGEKETAYFVKNNLTAHVEVLAGIVRECEKEGRIIQLPVFTALPFCALSAAAPSLMVALLEKNGAKKVFGQDFGKAKKFLLSDEAVKARVGLALRALSGGKQK